MGIVIQHNDAADLNSAGMDVSGCSGSSISSSSNISNSSSSSSSSSSSVSSKVASNAAAAASFAIDDGTGAIRVRVCAALRHMRELPPVGTMTHTQLCAWQLFDDFFVSVVPCISIGSLVYGLSSVLCFRRPPGSLVDIMGELHGTTRDQRAILCDAYAHVGSFFIIDFVCLARFVAAAMPLIRYFTLTAEIGISCLHTNLYVLSNAQFYS